MQDDSSVDVSIPNELILWRRVPPDKKVFDQNLNRMRPSSDAFCDHRNGTAMSVFDANASEGKEAVMEGHDGFLLCSFTAGEARARGMQIIRTSTGCPGHCEVIGKKTQRVKDKFARNALWVIGPDCEDGR